MQGWHSLPDTSGIWIVIITYNNKIAAIILNVCYFSLQ